jgi:hypothetical protein
MRIHLLIGGLLVLAATPVAAQEASDSNRVFAVPAGSPAAPTVQALFSQGDALARRQPSDSASPHTAAAMLGGAMAGAIIVLSLRLRRDMKTGRLAVS